MSSFNPRGRFVDPTLIETLTFKCPCVNTPHDEDTVVIRQEIGAGEEARAGAAGWAATEFAYYDFEAAKDKLISIVAVRWTFVDAQGDPLPVNQRSASLMPEDIRDAIAVKADEAASRARGKPLPNAPGVPSPRGSRGSASRTRKQRTPS